VEFIIVIITAFFTSTLTLFSGFGLGTMLLPVFALFFPVEVAIGMTAVVHFLNNILKLIILGKHADKSTTLRFGLPAIASAFVGALLLVWLADMQALYSYQLGGKTFITHPVQFIIGILILAFVLIEAIPAVKNLAIDKKYLPLGGVLSGFFGGLSGHQGALRSMFLLKAGLNRDSFIATGVVISCLVDFSRLIIYSSRFKDAFHEDFVGILIAAIMAAFAGVFIGSRLLKKVTMQVVKIIVSILLITIALGLISGLI
jgi:uncharacterized membrane protein YfcA